MQADLKTDRFGTEDGMAEVQGMVEDAALPFVSMSPWFCGSEQGMLTATRH